MGISLQSLLPPYGASLPLGKREREKHREAQRKTEKQRSKGEINHTKANHRRRRFYRGSTQTGLRPHWSTGRSTSLSQNRITTLTQLFSPLLTLHTFQRELTKKFQRIPRRINSSIVSLLCSSQHVWQDNLTSSTNKNYLRWISKVHNTTP